MRVVLADPPAFTPVYDHELAAALARAGAEVELVTSRFRFGAVPDPCRATQRRELFYPLSSRVFSRSRLRLPAKALEHPLGLARLARVPADVVHLQWLTPELDGRLPPPPRAARADRARPPAATDGREDRALAAALRPLRARRRAQRERPRGARRVRRPRGEAPRDPSPRLAERSLAGGRRPDRARARDDPARTSRSTTRPRRLGSRARASLSPAIPSARCRISTAPSSGSATSRTRRSSARSETPPSPSSPTAPSSTRAARSCRRSEPESRPSSMTSAASPSRFGATAPAASFPPTTSLRSAPRSRSCSAIPHALEAARAGARRARAELTWDAAAQAHLALYRELL